MVINYFCSNFLVVTKRLYIRGCPSVRRSVTRSCSLFSPTLLSLVWLIPPIILNSLLLASVPLCHPYSDYANISAENMVLRHLMKQRRLCVSSENCGYANIFIPPILNLTAHMMEVVRRWAVLSRTQLEHLFKKIAWSIFFLLFERVGHPGNHALCWTYPLSWT